MIRRAFLARGHYAEAFAEKCCRSVGKRNRPLSTSSNGLHHSSEVSLARPCAAHNIGLIEYGEAWTLQKGLIGKRMSGDVPDTILFLEHPPVYTLGRGAKTKNLKFDPDSSKHDVIRVDRGGEVTYHGPGQLVVYPILDLRGYRKDLHWYLRQVEEVVIETLAKLGLEGRRIDGLTGVWVDGRKIAAIGTHASKWITMHGFALNVTTDLTAFDEIIPCGIDDREVASIQQFRREVTMDDAIVAAVQSFEDVFGMKIEWSDTPPQGHSEPNSVIDLKRR